MKQPKTTTIDLKTAFYIAVALHVLLIVGVSFSAPGTKPRKTLDVAFTVNTTTNEKPIDAKHIAANDQIASGTAEEGLTPTTTEQSNRDGAVVQETEHRLNSQQNQNTAVAVITTQANQLIEVQDEQEKEEAEKESAGDSAIERQMAEIRALEARLAQEQQAYAQRPKIHRFTSVAALAATDAEYQRQWQDKVESIGNANYPRSAVAQGISGDVTLMVSINQNGSIKSINLIKSSGHKLLDRAAMSSVQLAAPFSAFPQELAKKADILEIYRTWQFRNNQLTTVES